MNKYFFYTLFAVLVLLPGFKCLPSNTRVIQGGIHYSDDQGATWQPRNLIISGQNQGSLDRVDILDLVIDPTNDELLLAATRSAGLYKSENSGESWTPVTTNGQIQSIDINPKQASEYVAARMNQIFFSEDSGEVWKLMYTNPSGQMLTDITFDHYNQNKIYATVATGELLISNDDAKTWSLKKRFDHSIDRIVVHPQLENRIYVFSKSKGVLRSDDAGENWAMITEGINSLILPLQFIDFDVHQKSIDSLLLASDKDLYISNDGGLNWSALSLLAEADQQIIRTVAWDTQLRNRIYYSTPTVFNESSDLGKTWKTTPFISRSFPADIVVHPKIKDRLYIRTIRP